VSNETSAVLVVANGWAGIEQLMPTGPGGGDYARAGSHVKGDF
jgi:hypothetical protein